MHHLEHHQQQRDGARGRAMTTVSGGLWSISLSGNSAKKTSSSNNTEDYDFDHILC